MKKLLSLLLAISTCLSCAVIFSSCKHEHNYEWEFTESEHWCWCKSDNCYEYKEVRKAHFPEIKTDDANESSHKVACSCGYYYWESHDFDEGIVTVEPSKESDGIKTFTCESCGYEKEETEYYIAKGNVISTVFDSAIAMEGVNNYGVYFKDQFSIIGGDKNLYFDGNNIYEEPYTYYTVEGSKKYWYNSDGNGGWRKEELHSDSSSPSVSLYEDRINLMANFAEDLDYHDFTYVGEYGGEGYYTASNITASNFFQASAYKTQKYQEIKIYFADNLLSQIYLKDTYGDEAYIRVEYGTANFTIPTV